MTMKRENKRLLILLTFLSINIYIYVTVHAQMLMEGICDILPCALVHVTAKGGHALFWL